ncbi:MAG TPA: FxLYD domain-containing protein [Candidatus Sulfomarinibacteraceae bacterium]|nr:FxLYD domain-containing protein [Candidatus Sulfomarinibacteraceae bacterium]
MRQIILLIVSGLLLAACAGGDELAGSTPAATGTHTPTPEIGVTLITRAPPTAALIQTTPTPLPTATATPTATPVIYEVEEGDTLLGIAIANYTSVEEIEALNPGVVPELLQIGQPLILPPPATPVYSGAAPTPVPMEVRVSNVQLARTSAGSMWIVGEVLNEGTTIAAGLRVQIDLLGPEGTALLSTAAWVVTAIVPPGEAAPFAVLVREPPAEDVQPAVSIVDGEGLVDPGNYYLDLAVQSPEVTIGERQVSLGGAVENVGEKTAHQITVVATFYDNQRNVTGYAQQALSDPLAPGESVPFALEAAPPGGPVVDYALDVYGLIQ